MNLKQFKAHMSYTLTHKFYVALECFKRGLYIQAITHDMSKFYPSEFKGYAEFFFDEEGNKKDIRNKTGYYKPDTTGDNAFDWAWFMHQARNKHHWQYYVYPKDDGGHKVMEIPDKYINEMISDFIGAGKAQGNVPSRKWYSEIIIAILDRIENYSEPAKQGNIDWYLENKHKLILHSNTRNELEKWLGLI
jgi:hypothetical protein